MIRASGLILVCLFAACTSSSPKPAARLTAKAHSDSELTPILRHQFPIGTPITEVREFMTREGFKCDIVTNGTFRYSVTEPGRSTEKRVIEHADFLQCTRQDRDGWVTAGVVAAIFFENDQVTEIIVDTAYTGP